MTTDDWRIEFIGTGSLISQPFRALPATLVDVGDHRYLFDCGDGTVARLRALDKLDIDVVAVTTTEPSELGGLLTLGEVNRRAKRNSISIAGPPGIKAALEALCSISTFSTAQLFDIVEANSGTALYTNGREHLEAVPLSASGGRSNGYLLFEMPLPGRVDAKKAKSLGVKGSDFSRLVAGETVGRVRPTDVIGPPRLGRRVIITGRGRATDELHAALQRSDVAIFAAPFTDDRLEIAEESGYLTGWEAAKLASENAVRLPAIQRLGGYSRVRYQLAEARQFNNRLIAPHDGDWIQLPLPERGAPQYHRNANPPVGAGSVKEPNSRQARHQRRSG